MSKSGISFAAFLLASGTAFAQVPTIDNANLAKAQEIATNTQQILEADRQIMQFTQRTLQAVTGDRTSQAQGQLSQIALGGGFSMGSAPSLESVISSGTMSFTGMGTGSQGLVSQLINGLQLVRSISGLINGQTPSFDKSYQNQVNMAGTIAGLINSTQGAVQARSSAFTQGGQSIGQAPDLKGSIDQNSQLQIQTGQTINELTGVVNNAVTATNMQNLDLIERQSSASRAMTFR